MKAHDTSVKRCRGPVVFIRMSFIPCGKSTCSLLKRQWLDRYCLVFLLRTTVAMISASTSSKTILAINSGSRAGAAVWAVEEGFGVAGVSVLLLEKTAAVRAKLWEMTSSADRELSAYAVS